MSFDASDKRVRETMRLMQAAVTRGWDLPDVMLRAIPSYAGKIIADETRDVRDRIRASELIATLRRDNMARLDALDRAERLESGGATDRITLLSSISDEQLSALAATMNAERRRAEKQCSPPNPQTTPPQ